MSSQCTSLSCSNGVCVKALGESCSTDPECGDETAMHCLMGTCTCLPNYIIINGVCTPGKALGETCTATEECTIITAIAECTSGVCSCPALYWNNAGTCRPGVACGDSCTYNGDCTAQNAENTCSSGICTDFVCSPVSVGGYVYRLAGGPSGCDKGRVELRQAGTSDWGYICDDSWDNIDAIVVCTSLGFSNGTSSKFSLYGHCGLTFYMDDVACDGSESHVVDCSYAGFGVHNCDLDEVASVMCS